MVPSLRGSAILRKVNVMNCLPVTHGYVASTLKLVLHRKNWIMSLQYVTTSVTSGLYDHLLAGGNVKFLDPECRLMWLVGYYI
jgi:hypothetical protein